MSTFQVPQRQNLRELLRDLVTRVRRLEAIPPRAKFEIKLFADAAWPDAVSITTTGDGRFIWEIEDKLDGAYLLELGLWCTTVGTGATVCQVRNETTTHDMLSTPVTIESGERSSRTAVTQPVINPLYQQVSAGDFLSIDVDTASDAQKGLGIWLTFGGF